MGSIDRSVGQRDRGWAAPEPLLPQSAPGGGSLDWTAAPLEGALPNAEERGKKGRDVKRGGRGKRLRGVSFKLRANSGSNSTPPFQIGYPTVMYQARRLHFLSGCLCLLHLPHVWGKVITGELKSPSPAVFPQAIAARA